MDRAFDGILRDLRTQYLLAYYPKNVPLTSDPFHTLTVIASDPSWKVASRNGYYGDAETVSASPAGKQPGNPSVSVDVTPGDETVRTPRKPAPKPAPAGKGSQ